MLRRRRTISLPLPAALVSLCSWSECSQQQVSKSIPLTCSPSRRMLHSDPPPPSPINFGTLSNEPLSSNTNTNQQYSGSSTKSNEKSAPKPLVFGIGVDESLTALEELGDVPPPPTSFKLVSKIDKSEKYKNHSSSLTMEAMVSVIPAFFVPLEEVLRNIPGYSENHLRHYLSGKEGFQMVGIPRLSDGKSIHYVRFYGNSGITPMDQSRSAALRYQDFEPDVRLATCFYDFLHHSSPGRGTELLRLSELLQRSPSALVRRLPFQGPANVLFFAQFQHYFQVAALSGGGGGGGGGLNPLEGMGAVNSAVRLAPIESVKGFDCSTTPIPVALNEIHRRLDFNQETGKRKSVVGDRKVTFPSLWESLDPYSRRQLLQQLGPGTLLWEHRKAFEQHCTDVALGSVNWLRPYTLEPHQLFRQIEGVMSAAGSSPWYITLRSKESSLSCQKILTAEPPCVAQLLATASDDEQSENVMEKKSVDEQEREDITTDDQDFLFSPFSDSAKKIPSSAIEETATEDDFLLALSHRKLYLLFTLVIYLHSQYLATDGTHLMTRKTFEKIEQKKKSLEDQLKDLLEKKQEAYNEGRSFSAVNSEVRQLRRKIALAQDPNNPLTDLETLSQACYAHLPRKKYVPFRDFITNLPEDLKTFLPERHLHFFRSRSHMFTLFELKPQLFNIQRAGLPLPRGTLREEKYRDRELVFLVASILEKLGGKASLVKVESRIPELARLQIRQEYGNLVGLMKRFHEYFGLSFISEETKMDMRLVTGILLKTPDATFDPNLSSGEG